MMNKNSYNFNVKFYKLLGYVWFLSPIFLLSFIITKYNPTWEGFWIGFLFYAIYWGILCWLRYSLKVNVISLSKLFKKPKSVFHEELGYFSIYFFGSSNDKNAYIEIYKQSFLTLSYIDNRDIISSEQIKNDIKIILDRRYKDKLNRIKRKEEESIRQIELTEKDKISKSYLDQWDGYLSTVGRRDEKIKSILKK